MCPFVCGYVFALLHHHKHETEQNRTHTYTDTDAACARTDPRIFSPTRNWCFNEYLALADSIHPESYRLSTTYEHKEMYVLMSMCPGEQSTRNDDNAQRHKTHRPRMHALICSMLNMLINTRKSVAVSSITSNKMFAMIHFKRTRSHENQITSHLITRTYEEHNEHTTNRQTKTMGGGGSKAERGW